MESCYRHPGRETGVSCSSCGRPICPDCMTPTPVGMRCPECARSTTKVRTMRSLEAAPSVTQALIAANVIMFIGELAGGGGAIGSASGTVTRELALFGPAISEANEYWRLITSGFLHAGLIHLFFNMYLLWMLGQMLEPSLGHVRFAILYFTSLLAGSCGALLVSPLSLTVGASGAVFGLMGAAFVGMRARGMDPMESGIGPLIILNLVITFAIPGIAIGGHIGGLVGGVVAGWLLFVFADRAPNKWLAPVLAAGVGVAAAIGAVAAAGSSGL